MASRTAERNHLWILTKDMLACAYYNGKMSGVELGHEIGRRYPGLPSSATSGYSHVLADEGRNGFELLQKPYALGQLSRVLRCVS
jgi:hypothetical protein